MAQGLQLMRKNAGVGRLLANAALREHHRILDEAIKLEDWSKAEGLFVQVSPSFKSLAASATFENHHAAFTGPAMV